MSYRTLFTGGVVVVLVVGLVPRGWADHIQWQSDALPDGGLLISSGSRRGINDSSHLIADIFGVPEDTLTRYRIDGPVGTVGPFSVNGSTTAGSWTTSDPSLEGFFVIKAGKEFIVYDARNGFGQLSDQLSGSWSTQFLNGKDVSHISFYVAVPEPGTVALFAMSLVGLGAWRRRKNKGA